MKNDANATLDDLLKIVPSKKGAETHFTIKELAESWKMPVVRVRALLHHARTAGRLDVGTVYRKALDGAERPVPGYRILPAKADKKKLK